jgi:transcription antitermination factor NusG
MGSFQQQRVQTVQTFLPEFPLDRACERRWFAVYTNSRHEKTVAQHLIHREIEHFLPLYQSQRKWNNGLKVTLDLPLFPGYLFVHIDRNERARVLNVPGALALVGGTGREPAPLPDQAIDGLRVGLQQRHIEPHPLLTVGQRARILSGAMVGMEGVVLRRKNSCRVILTLEHIQRSIAVDVDENDLEPVAGGDLRSVNVSLDTNAQSLTTIATVVNPGARSRGF